MLKGSLTLAAKSRAKAYYCDRFLQYPKSVPRSLTWQALLPAAAGNQHIDLRPIFCDGDRFKRNITLGSLVKIRGTTSAKLEIVLQSSRAAQPILRPGHNVIRILSHESLAPFTTHTELGKQGLEVSLRSRSLEVAFSCTYGAADE